MIKIWFLETGQEVEVVGKHNNKLIVKPTGKVIEMGKEDYYEYTWYDRFPNEEMIVEKIYDSILETPSIKEYKKQIEGLKKKKSELTKDINDIKKFFDRFTALKNAITEEGEIIQPKYIVHISSNYDDRIFIEKVENLNVEYGGSKAVIRLSKTWLWGLRWEKYDSNNYTSKIIYIAENYEDAKSKLQDYLDTRYFKKMDFSSVPFSIKEKYNFIEIPNKYIVWYNNYLLEHSNKKLESIQKDKEEYKLQEQKLIEEIKKLKSNIKNHG